MDVWHQNYLPFDSVGLSALAASGPIILFFICLAVLRMKGHVAAALTLALSMLIAVAIFHMPLGMALASASELIGSGDKRVVMQDIDIPDASYVARTIRLPDCAKAMMTTLHPRTPSPARLPVWSVLTTREQEIAELASEGLTTRAIAQRAFISENTVKQHLKRIFAKTDVNSRAELVQLIWATTHSEQTPAAAMAG